MFIFVDMIEAENQSKLNQEKTINSSCDDMLSWLQGVSKELSTPVTLSAKDDVLKEQCRNHEVSLCCDDALRLNHRYDIPRSSFFLAACKNS